MSRLYDERVLSAREVGVKFRRRGALDPAWSDEPQAL